MRKTKSLEFCAELAETLGEEVRVLANADEPNAVDLNEACRLLGEAQLILKKVQNVKLQQR